MGLDASIPLQVRQPADPMESMGKMLALKQLTMQTSDLQQKQDQERTLADLYKGAIDPTTGKVDSGKLLSGMASAGLGSHIPAYQKQVAEADKASAELGKTKVETEEKQYKLLKQRVDASNGMLASLLSQPNVTHDDVIRAMSGLVDQGIIKPDEGATAIRSLPGRPEQLRPFLMQKALEGMEADKRLGMMLPKFEKVNDGQVTRFPDMNPITNPTGPAPIQMQATPGDVLQAKTSRENNASTNATTRRGQDMTDARTREQLQQGKVPQGYRMTPDGNLQAISGGPADPNIKPTQAANKVLPLLDDAEKLLDKSTGSYIGAGWDQTQRLFGATNKGANAAAQLKALEGQIMMAQPRMEGPQSDKDVALYRQMAGQIGDATLPNETRKAALKTVRELYQKYSGGGATTGTTTQGTIRAGTVEDGYVFIGGDPANPSSWKKAGK